RSIFGRMAPDSDMAPTTEAALTRKANRLLLRIVHPVDGHQPGVGIDIPGSRRTLRVRTLRIRTLRIRTLRIRTLRIRTLRIRRNGIHRNGQPVRTRMQKRQRTAIFPHLNGCAGSFDHGHRSGLVRDPRLSRHPVTDAIEPNTTQRSEQVLRLRAGQIQPEGNGENDRSDGERPTSVPTKPAWLGANVVESRRA